MPNMGSKSQSLCLFWDKRNVILLNQVLIIAVHQLIFLRKPPELEVIIYFSLLVSRIESFLRCRNSAWPLQVMVPNTSILHNQVVAHRNELAIQFQFPYDMLLAMFRIQ